MIHPGLTFTPGRHPVSHVAGYGCRGLVEAARKLAVMLGACGVAGALLGADLTISVDTTKTGTDIPANFLGFSFTRQYINGPGGIQRLFDRSAYITANGTDTNYVHFTNLIK